jgi:hypothetical protein
MTWSQLSGGPAHGKVTFKHVYEIKQNAHCVSSLDQSLEGKSRAGIVRVINPQYRFSLKRESLDGRWKITDVEVPYKESDEYEPGGPKGMVAVVADAPLRIWTNPFGALPEFIQVADFKILSATPVKRGEQELVRFDFTSRPQRVMSQVINGRKGFGILMVSGGWVLLDPNRYWLIEEYGLNVSNLSGTKSGKWSGNMNYKEGQDGFPIISRISVKVGDGSSVANEYLYEFSLQQREVPDREFTLSAYGLPEPAGVRLPAPWYLWALGVSVLCFMIAAAFHRHSRKSGGTSR